MENIYKKIENELLSLSEADRYELLNKLRAEVDLIDEKLVKQLSDRTLCAVLIGRIKRSLELPTYDPAREKDISKKISNYLEEPLSQEALTRIYERIIDESRAIQKLEAEKGNIKISRLKNES
jgi:chorismate mutase